MLGNFLSSDIGLFLSIALAAGGSVLGIVRWLAGRLITDMLTRIDGAIVQMDKIMGRVNAVEERLERHLSDLPLQYQRRDDAIREYTTINVKLDRLYELMLRSDK